MFRLLHNFLSVGPFCILLDVESHLIQGAVGFRFADFLQEAAEQFLFPMIGFDTRDRTTFDHGTKDLSGIQQICAVRLAVLDHLGQVDFLGSFQRGIFR